MFRGHLQRKLMKMKMLTNAMIVTKRICSRPSMQIRKPLPSINVKPEGVKARWFRDPNTFYWIQLDEPTGKFNFGSETSFLLFRLKLRKFKLKKYWTSKRLMRNAPAGLDKI